MKKKTKVKYLNLGGLWYWQLEVEGKVVMEGTEGFPFKPLAEKAFEAAKEMLTQGGKGS